MGVYVMRKVEAPECLAVLHKAESRSRTLSAVSCTGYRQNESIQLDPAHMRFSWILQSDLVGPGWLDRFDLFRHCARQD
jgi:hypothetical protein